MRLFLCVFAVSMLVAVPALAATSSVTGAATGVSGGAGTVRPGFCWSEGVVVVTPPYIGVYSPLEVGIYSPAAGAGDISLAPALNAAGNTAANAAARVEANAGTSDGRQPATAEARPQSQMYVPPAVWQWVAAHPVRRP